VRPSDSTQYRRSLFLFRRDLRLEDNSALIAAIKHSQQVYTAFHIDQSLWKKQRTHANHFLCACLEELQSSITERDGELLFLQGKIEKALRTCIKELEVEALFINRDYSAYGMKRDQTIRSVCEKVGIPVYEFSDQLLLEPEEGLKGDGSAYKVFTPFFKNARQKLVTKPSHCPKQGFTKVKTRSVARPKLLNVLPGFVKSSLQADKRLPRKQIEDTLKNITRYQDYEKQRDIPALNATTHLSAALRFGVCSVREAFHAVQNKMGGEHPLLRQLYWRDFFTHIGFYFPHSRHKAFKSQYDNIAWSNDRKKFQRWCEGRTGFPIVDAGMRELNATGYMHNRVRMITASFLVKDLQINWQWGERYFADKLIDYDPCVNNGNWQWVASTGCDAQPWFRIFNPWLQQKKFDPDAEYIKTWVPELREVTARQIHMPEGLMWGEYPSPLVQHQQAARITKQLYGECVQ